MNEKLKDRDILLVREKGSSELHAAGTGKDGSKQFSANVQFNTDKRYFELVFDNDRKQSQNVKQGN